LALAPLCLPLPNLLSVKYAIPFLMFVPSFLVLCLSSIEDQLPNHLKQWPVVASLVSSSALILFPASLTGAAPFIHFGTIASRPVGTHDGLRSYGGYLWQMATRDRFSPRSEHQILADQIKQEFFQSAGPDLLIAGGENVFDPGGLGWRELQPEPEFLAVHGAVISPHQIQFERNGRRLTLTRDLPQDFKQLFDRGSGVKLYDLREHELS